MICNFGLEHIKAALSHAPQPVARHKDVSKCLSPRPYPVASGVCAGSVVWGCAPHWSRLVTTSSLNGSVSLYHFCVSLLLSRTMLSVLGGDVLVFFFDSACLICGHMDILVF